jgi:hypothetical protein
MMVLQNYVIGDGMQRYVGPCNHVKARAQIAAAGTASKYWRVADCEYIE